MFRKKQPDNPERYPEISREEIQYADDFLRLITSLKDDIDDVGRGLSKLEERYGRLLRNYESVMRVHRDFPQVLFTLKHQNYELTKRLEFLEGELKEGELRVNGLLAELARYRTDKSSTYQSDSQHKNHLLVEEFKYLGDQDFHSVSINLLNSTRDINLTQPERKKLIANIKSILSTEIFVNSAEHFSKGKKREPEDDLTPSILSAIYIRLRAVAPHLRPEIVEDDLQALVARGLDLRQRISSADPPGTLWLAREGEPFEPTAHRIALGCEDSGNVLFTVYPGYEVDNRLLEKAVVFTTEAWQ